jgi:hypothetical protein
MIQADASHARSAELGEVVRHVSLWCGLAVGLIGSLACSTQASTVRLAKDSDAVRDCAHLGRVEGSDRKDHGMLYQGVAENNATYNLRENAAKLGANTVVLAKGMTDNSGSTQVGEAYRCPEVPATR